MRSIIFLLIISGYTATSAFSQDNNKNQKSVETEFHVSGVCNMCKERIETAAIYVKGVRFSEWDKKEQKLKVVYNGKKTDEEAIQKAVAAAGHDTEKIEATREQYENIPDCCRYRDGVEIH